jgi:hypothetical protein
MQSKYAETVLARGDLPREIIAKYRRMQELDKKAYSGSKPNPQVIRELTKIATELLPYLHFKIDDVNWRKQ